MTSEPGSLDIRWVWAFLDTPREDAGRSWAFWSTVTGWPLSARRGDTGELATLLPATGDPWVRLQAVDEGGGVHLDLDVDDPAAAAVQAQRLGAREVRRSDGDTVVVLTSPGGQAFCLTTWARAGSPSRQVRDGARELLDQVCLDIPMQAWDREVAFWADLTGWPYAESPEPEFAFLERPPALPVRLLLQRLEEPAGVVRAHVDCACADRAASRRRHEAAGAVVEQERGFWSVLRDPVGRRYCLTDRSPQQGWVTGGAG